jgi:hypothetical protein
VLDLLTQGSASADEYKPDGCVVEFGLLYAVASLAETDGWLSRPARSAVPGLFPARFSRPFPELVAPVSGSGLYQHPPLPVASFSAAGAAPAPGP